MYLVKSTCTFRTFYEIAFLLCNLQPNENSHKQMHVSGPWTVWSGSHGSSTPWQTSTAGSSTAWSPGNHHLLRRRKIQNWRENIPASKQNGGKFHNKKLAWNIFYQRMRVNPYLINAYLFHKGFSTLEKKPWYVIRGQCCPSSRAWLPGMTALCR
jgi:hypothetical protein